ncbi:E3 SUMO-protein ligase ZBED1-like [Drosophila sulfurigaster albostrigata]|uniref:E3 SUMO-protein ligase ZBED1-like n=1 Tax=Drosophila sulfurigaster albostrigata TaxID=89887 RepID=UPI002D21D31A|nr:E3 SUMO-protein ligase ZBED1-like [Drosophila sulfurigaster albostrigata]
MLKDIEKVLAFFQQASEKISGGKYVTISLIIPMTYGLFRKIESVVPLLQTLQGKTLNKILMESIKQRLSVYEQRTVCRMATLLDPRFKKSGFQHSSNAEQAATCFENELANFPVKETASNQPVAPDSSLQDTLFDFLGERSMNNSVNSRVDAILTKRQYLERAIVGQDIDPLLWMKVNQTDFPAIGSLFAKYLCIPATSVESERTFSKAGQIISERRTRLKEKMLTFFCF